MSQQLANSIAKQILQACKGNPAAASQTMADVGKQLLNNNSSILMDIMKVLKK